MAEVREFALPDLGEGLTEATIVRWLVAVGDAVATDQPVVEVETAKALVDVPCPYDGVVTARYGDEGAEIPVGTPLVTVATGAGAGAGPTAGPGPGADAGTDPGARAGGEPEQARDPAGGTDGADRADRAVDVAADEGSGNVLVGYGTSAPTGRRRRVRPRENGRPGEPVRPGEDGERPGTAESGQGPTEPGAGTADTPRTVAVISPLVRRLAREHGIDLRDVTGSGADGLILRADIERAAAAAGAPPAPAPTEPAQAAPAQAAPVQAATTPAAPAGGKPAPRNGERIPLTGMRGAAADKLSRSRREIPDASCWVDADATELLRTRRAMNDRGYSRTESGEGTAHDAPKISLLALLARVCTAALARYPELNATVDTEAREIVRLPEVHLGFAAQTDRGLVVPVVRNAHTLGATGLQEEMARLTGAARSGSLTPAELTGGTFTLNNYGVFGVDGSTPIINHPEAAMLGVGRIAEKPWAVEGALAVRHVVNLSFTFDHRVCDGGTAGGFLRYVADCVEQPAVLLRTL